MKYALLILVCLSSGCVVSEAAKAQIETTALATDNYHRLVTQTLDGSIPPGKGTPVSKTDLERTPPSVRQLLQNLLASFAVLRKAAHQLHFAIGGPDVSGLDLKPIALPALAPPNTGPGTPPPGK